MGSWSWRSLRPVFTSSSYVVKILLVLLYIYCAICNIFLWLTSRLKLLSCNFLEYFSLCPFWVMNKILITTKKKMEKKGRLLKSGFILKNQNEGLYCQYIKIQGYHAITGKSLNRWRFRMVPKFWIGSAVFSESPCALLPSVIGFTRVRLLLSRHLAEAPRRSCS